MPTRLPGPGRSQALYDILEKQIIPLFYKRTVDNIPREWIARMKNCMRKLGAGLQHQPHGARVRREVLSPRRHARRGAGADNLARAKALAKAKDRSAASGAAVKIVGVHTSGNGHYRVGENMQVEALSICRHRSDGIAGAVVRRADQRHRPDRGAADAGDEHTKLIANGRHLFTGTIECRTSGRHGFAIRILPGSPDMATPFEPGLILWNQTTRSSHRCVSTGDPAQSQSGPGPQQSRQRPQRQRATR
jgi:glycogen phosphorylase